MTVKTDYTAHLQAVQEEVVNPIAPDKSKSASLTEFCESCSVTIMKQNWSRHVNGTAYRKKKSVYAFRATVEKTENDKHDITVSGDFDFGIVDVSDVQKGIVLPLQIEIGTRDSRVKFIKASTSFSDARIKSYG